MNPVWNAGVELAPRLQAQQLGGEQSDWQLGERAIFGGEMQRGVARGIGLGKIFCGQNFTREGRKSALAGRRMIVDFSHERRLEISRQRQRQANQIKRAIAGDWICHASGEPHNQSR